jgi:hypothetical protein
MGFSLLSYTHLLDARKRQGDIALSEFLGLLRDGVDDYNLVVDEGEVEESVFHPAEFRAEFPEVARDFTGILPGQPVSVLFQ